MHYRTHARSYPGTHSTAPLYIHYRIQALSYPGIIVPMHYRIQAPVPMHYRIQAPIVPMQYSIQASVPMHYRIQAPSYQSSSYPCTIVAMHYRTHALSYMVINIEPFQGSPSLCVPSISRPWKGRISVTIGDSLWMTAYGWQPIDETTYKWDSL